MIDRPVGTPMVSRDGVSIASEIELADRFENMGAQVVREVSYQTNEVAGDGTTTAMVSRQRADPGRHGGPGEGRQPGRPDQGHRRGRCRHHGSAQRVRPSRSATDLSRRSPPSPPRTRASDRWSPKRIERVGADGIITSDYGITIENSLQVIEGMSFDRGYISHHMVTDVERMEAVLENPYILLTDLKNQAAGRTGTDTPGGRRHRASPRDHGRRDFARCRGQPSEPGRQGQDSDRSHPPEYGHWRKAMMEDIAILIGGRVIARDLGGVWKRRSWKISAKPRQVRASASETIISRGAGDADAITARRAAGDAAVP